MLTMFTIPKPFNGYIGTIQRNAIKSWTLLYPKCEIILFGDEEGVAEAAEDLKVKHSQSIKRNSYGTPLLNDMFEQAEKIASNDFMCLVNCDIILMGDFMAALERLKGEKRPFLMCGRRRNVDIREPYDFSEGWEGRMRAFVNATGRLVPPNSIDFFVYRKGLWGEVPAFAIGRPRYDNWMIYTALDKGAMVIDATPAVMSVHQNHDYLHVPKGNNNSWEGPEGELNKGLYGREKPLYSLEDASHTLTESSLQRAFTVTSAKHRVQKLFRHKYIFKG